MPRPRTITDTQARRIVELRNSGCMFKDIAKQVSLNTRTVRNWHYKRLMRLAGIPNR